MHLEVRQQGKKKKYYLAHGIRWLDKVRKLRVYLGSDLSEENLKKRRREAEIKLGRRITEMQLGEKVYPFYNPVDAVEFEEIRMLERKPEIKISHLTEDEWKIFTELFTYHTNAIEGSTVTFPEVVNVLEKDEWPKNKTKDEISETYGVAEAVKYIRETRNHISIDLIKKLHYLTFKNSKPFAGKFRGKGVEVGIVDSAGRVIHIGAPAEEIINLLNELIRWYDKYRLSYPSLVLASVVHNQFELIHPFQDGNGRVGRLLLNNILLKHRLPPVNIELRHRKNYYRAIRIYQRNRNIRPMIELIMKEYREFRKSLKAG